MSGFRLWLNDFVVSMPDTSGSTVDDGKITNSDNTYGYTHDTDGVSRCLLDLCTPLITLSGNGQGWEVNTDLCPNSKPIKLVGTNDAYAMFFKNTSKHRNLMIALPLYGYNNTIVSGSSIRSYINIPFLRTHLCDYAPAGNYGNYGIMCNDICMSMTFTDEDVWDPSAAINDEAFYPINSTPIMFLSTYFGSASTYSYYSSVSLVNYGNSDTGTSSSTDHQYGPTIGSRCRYFILANEDGDIGIGASYKDKRPYMVFAGNFYSNKLDENDILPTAKACYFYVNHCDLANTAGLWCYSSNATTTYSYTSYDVYIRLQDFTVDGKYLNAYDQSNSSKECTAYRNMYITNPSLRQYNSLYKTAHQIITNTGFLDKEKIRAIDRTGTAIGQSYNSKQWCFISTPVGNIDDNYSPMTVWTSTDSGAERFGVVIRWDGEYNGNKTIY